MGKNILAASSGEIVTLQRLKQYLRINYDCDDERLFSLMGFARQMLEEYLQKTFLPSVWKYTVGDRHELLSESGSSLFSSLFSRGGRSCVTILLPRPSVIRITNVVMGGEEAPEEVPTEDYRLENVDGKYYLQLCRAKSASGESKMDFPLVITYESGMYSTISEVPTQLKLANMAMTQSLCQTDFFDEGGSVIPQKIEQMLAPFRNVSMI